MLNRGLLDNACCIHCGELETLEHLLFQCEFAQEVWRLAPFKTTWETSTIAEFIAGFTASKHLICLPPIGLASVSLFPWVCWSICSARNYLCFENRTFSPQDTLNKALVEARDWQYAQTTTEPQTVKKKAGNLTPIPPDYITCHSGTDRGAPRTSF